MDFLDKIIEIDLKRQDLIKRAENKKRAALIKRQCGSCTKWMTNDCRVESLKKVKSNDFACSDLEVSINSLKTIQKLLKP